MSNQPKQTNVYLIPGLGGDKRMYEGQLNKFQHTKVLEFIAPLPNETMNSYARRLAKSIDFENEFILIGVSLGGVIAQEIASFTNPKKVIVISSVKTRKELPIWMRIFKYIPLPKLIPGNVYLWAFLILVWLKQFWTRRNFIMKRLKDMAKDANPDFVYWAANQMVSWKEPFGEKVFQPVVIHGNRDYLFPIHWIKEVDYVIPKGTHAMILTHVKLINEALQIELTD